MKRAAELTDDEVLILAWFAHFLEKDGIDGLAKYLTHCGIKATSGMTAGESILAHYRNPLGYDIERAAMDLRMWPPIAARLIEVQMEEAERRSTASATRVRAHRSKRINDHRALHHI